jgi:hypothetical protein
VIDESRVVGVVSARDLLKSALAAVLGYGEMAQKKLLNTLRVKDAMSEPQTRASLSSMTYSSPFCAHTLRISLH